MLGWGTPLSSTLVTIVPAGKIASKILVHPQRIQRQVVELYRSAGRQTGCLANRGYTEQRHNSVLTMLPTMANEQVPLASPIEPYVVRGAKLSVNQAVYGTVC